MRRILIALLLAGVASPTFAAEPRRDGLSSEDRAEARAERKAERKAERSSQAPAAERTAPQRSVEPRSMDRPMPQRNVELRGLDKAPEPRGFEPKAVEIDRPGRHMGASPEMSGGAAQSSSSEGVELRRRGGGVRDGRLRDRPRPVTIEERNLRRAPPISESGDLVQQRRDGPRVFERAERRISRRPILGTEPPPPRTATAIAARPARHWSHDWRGDRRYDWRDWRRRHHSHFHFGFYNDPFGWDYFRYGIGWRLWPNYYRSSYWLNDPWQYRLPPAYGPYRWVRYFNDALLVNIYTGEVVDVEYNFFW